MDKMILVDLETQDFSVKAGIYEVACLVIKNYEIIDKLYLGKEMLNYKGEKKYGHGFYDISKDLNYISKFKKLLKKYSYPIVAHNCSFDKKFLVYYQWIRDNYPTYCSITAIKKCVPYLKSYSLDYLVRYYKISQQVDHTAMSDTENLFKILKILKPKFWKPLLNSNNRMFCNIKPRVLEDIDLNIETTSILKDEVVCFSGQSEYPRNTMQEIAIKNGAKLSSNITKKTTILVVGLNPGSKLNRAKEKGISIITDHDFLEMLSLSDIDVLN